MRISRLHIAAIILSVLSPSAALGQLENSFTYQGRLGEGGSPANGSYEVKFELFDVPVGGTSLIVTHLFPSLLIEDGLFSVTLNYGVSTFDGTARYIEITVDGNVLTPRQRIFATPMALQTRGLHVNGLKNVGVGTTTPAERLHVDGNLRVDGWIGSDINQDVIFRVNDVEALRLQYEQFDDGSGPKPTPNIVGGSPANRIEPGAVGSVIVGGGFEEFNGLGHYISDSFCTIVGGRDNQAGDNAVGIRGQYATTVGGFSNAALGDYTFVGGGYDSRALGTGSAVVGGWNNSAQGGDYNFIGGGFLNDMGASNDYSVIAGGRENFTKAQYATVPGGYLNEATGDYSFAAGRRAKADHAGSLVWADSSNSDFASTGNNQFLVRASGGMGLNTPAPLARLHVLGTDLGLGSASASNEDLLIESDDAILGLYSSGSGAWSSGLVLGEVDGAGSLVDKWAMVRQSVGATSRLHLTYGTSSNYAANSQIVSINKTGQVGLGILPFFPLHMSSGAHCTVGGTWTNASSRTLKENFEPVDRQAILGRVMEMPVTRWNYKVEGETIEHIGPMAEDFAAAFATGETDTAIATIDADGVALASIQALYDIIKEKDAEIDSLRTMNSDLDARLARIEKKLGEGRVKP